MKRKLFSTAFGLLLTLAMVLPINHSFVNVNDTFAKQVNVNGGCLIVRTDGIKVNTCDGGLQQLDVSWNSGGG